MTLPAALLRHEVVVEAPIGTDGRGVLYGPPRTVPAYVEDGDRTARSTSARTVAGSTQVWVQLDYALTAEARVTVRGVARVVLSVAHFDSGLGTPDHTVLTLE